MRAITTSLAAALLFGAAPAVFGDCAKGVDHMKYTQIQSEESIVADESKPAIEIVDVDAQPTEASPAAD